MPLTISAIIPAYNSAALISQTLESVLAQTYPVGEVIVIDDGSTDRTVEVVQSFGQRVNLIEQNHRGVSAARNRGIRQVRSEYIAFIDSDDLWKPDKLGKQIACLIENDVSWVCCAAGYFDSQTGQGLSGYAKPLFEGDILEKEFLHSFILSPTPVVKRSIFEEVGDFNEEVRIGEDWDMWLRIGARYRLAVVREELALKREHPQSTMQSTTANEKLKDQLRVVEMAVEREPVRLGPLQKRLVAQIYRDHAIELVKSGAYQQARPYLAQAQQRDPGSLKVAAYRLAVSLGDKNAERLFGLVRRGRRS